MRLLNSYIFLCLILTSFFAPVAWASTCKEHFPDLEKAQEITGLTKEQLAEINEGSGAILSLEQVQAQGIPENSILLGPSGRLYSALLNRYRLLDFWAAHYSVKMNPEKEQTDDRLYEFFSRLNRQTKYKVYFLIPESYQKTLITSSEILVLLKHPELMANSHFIYSTKVNFKMIELDAAQSPTRTGALIQKLVYYFRFLIY